MKEIIQELRSRSKVDQDRYDQIRGGTLVKNRFEMKHKQLINYHRGRVSAYADAIKLLKYGDSKSPEIELLRWRAMERAHYEAGRKGGMQNPVKPKAVDKTVEYYIGRECAFTEAVTLIERVQTPVG